MQVVNHCKGDFAVVEDRLRVFSDIEGFEGVGIFTSTWESFAILADDRIKVKQVGPLANSVMNEAEKASAKLGTGAVDMVYIEGEHGHVIVKCRYEGADQLIHEPGKAHVHIIVFLSPDANVGLARIKMKSIIEKLGEDFWIWCRIKQYWQVRR